MCVYVCTPSATNRSPFLIPFPLSPVSSFFFSVVKREHAADVKDVFFRLLHAKMHERKGRSHKYSPKFQRQLILRYLVDCKTEAGSSMLMDGFLQQVVLPFSSTGAPPTINTPAGAEPNVDALMQEFNFGADIHSCVPVGRQVGTWAGVRVRENEKGSERGREGVREGVREGGSK